MYFNWEEPPTGSVNKPENRILSHFQFAQCFYVNTICREKFHESKRRRLEKHLFS